MHVPEGVYQHVDSSFMMTSMRSRRQHLTSHCPSPSTGRVSPRPPPARQGNEKRNHHGHGETPGARGTDCGCSLESILRSSWTKLNVPPLPQLLGTVLISISTPHPTDRFISQISSNDAAPSNRSLRHSLPPVVLPDVPIGERICSRPANGATVARLPAVA